MPKATRTEEAFQALLEGAPAQASAQVQALAKLAQALEPAALPQPDPRFRARLRSELLAHATASEEELFAAMLQGELSQAPEEIRPLVAVASALTPATLPQPQVAFRYQLRNALLAESAKPTNLAARVADRLGELNTRLRRSLRVVTATGMAAMLMLGSSAALAASANALPGDALYGLKRLRESAQLAVVSGDAEGVSLLAFAQERLDEVAELDAIGETDQRLFTTALDEMDRLTTRAAEIIIGAFRARGGKQPEALKELQGFAQTQRLQLTQMLDRLPPAVRPAALDSIVVAEAVQTKATVVLANPACPCDDNPLAPSVNRDDSSEPVACDCGSTAPGGQSTPPQDRTGDGSPDDTPDEGEGDTGDGDGDGDGDGGDGGSDDDVDVPDVDGTDVDDQAEDVINDLIDDLGDAVPSPSPLPSDPLSVLP